LVEYFCVPEMHKKERVITFDYQKYDDEFYVCVKIFLLSAYLQVGNNCPVLLIQRIYELMFLNQILKSSEK
jgi:hypothetical protein